MSQTELQKFDDAFEEWRELHNVLEFLKAHKLFIGEMKEPYGFGSGRVVPLIERDIEQLFYQDQNIDPAKLEAERRELFYKAIEAMNQH